MRKFGEFADFDDFGEGLSVGGKEHKERKKRGALAFERNSGFRKFPVFSGDE